MARYKGFSRIARERARAADAKRIEEERRILDEKPRAPTHCNKMQQSDEWFCSTCTSRWDTHDAIVPICPITKRPVDEY